MPYAIKDAVGQELDRLESQSIIKKVDTSDWAAPSQYQLKVVSTYVETTKSP
jgi:hypothetical protein